MTSTKSVTDSDIASEVAKPKLTVAEQDAALMAAYKEKFGGDITATFEDGKPSEMGRAVRNNMFRCTSYQKRHDITRGELTAQTYERCEQCHRKYLMH